MHVLVCTLHVFLYVVHNHLLILSYQVYLCMLACTTCTCFFFVEPLLNSTCYLIFGYFFDLKSFSALFDVGRDDDPMWVHCVFK